MNQKRLPEEFKIEAVRQIVERGHPVAEVSARLGVSTHSLYKWMKEQQLPPGQLQEQLSQTEELRRLKAELKRVTEERDIFKKAAAYFAKQSGRDTRSLNAMKRPMVLGGCARLWMCTQVVTTPGRSNPSVTRYAMT